MVLAIVFHSIADNKYFVSSMKPIYCYITTNFNLGAKILRGECFSLKASSNMEIRDTKCNREAGFVCEWAKPRCPDDGTEGSFSHLGQLSSGRDCFGLGEPAIFADGTCNSQNDLLRTRWTPKRPYDVDFYRRNYG